MDKTTFQGRYARNNKRRIETSIPDSGLLCKIKNIPTGDEYADEANKQSKFIRSTLTQLNSLPLFDNLEKSQGSSWSFLNFTSKPVTVIDRQGMRLLLTPTPVQEMNYLSDNEFNYFRRSNCVYAIKQYAMTSFQIDTLFKYIVICNNEKLQDDFLQAMRFSPVFKEISSQMRTLFNTMHDVEETSRATEIIDEITAKFLNYAEFERSLSEPWRCDNNDIVARMLANRRGQTRNQNYIPYFRFPLVFRIDSERIAFAGDRGVYDEHSDCVFTFADFNSEVFHPYDVNINKPLTAGQLVHGGRMEKLVLRHMEEHLDENGSIVDYQYVIDPDKYQGEHRPKDLYISSSIQGIAKRLKPEVGNPELYSEGYGVYVTYADYDHETGKNVVKRKFIDINDYATLECFGVFEGESTARAKTDKKARTEWEVANDTAHAKKIKEWTNMQMKLEAAEKAKIDAENAKITAERSHERLMLELQTKHAIEMARVRLEAEQEMTKERNEAHRRIEEMAYQIKIQEITSAQKDKEDIRKNETMDKDSKRKTLGMIVSGIAGAATTLIGGIVALYFKYKFNIPVPLKPI